jgi:hypothetical protein
MALAVASSEPGSVMRHGRLARLLLLFWSLWFAIVSLSNLADLAVGVGLLSPETWWKSGNLAMIASAVAPLGLQTAAPLLLVGVILWEAVASALFLRAFALDRGAPTAFLFGVGLFLVFVLLDEALLLFESGVEGTHVRVVIAQLVSLLVVDRLGTRGG